MLAAGDSRGSHMKLPYRFHRGTRSIIYSRELNLNDDEQLASARACAHLFLRCRTNSLTTEINTGEKRRGAQNIYVRDLVVASSTSLRAPGIRHISAISRQPRTYTCMVVVWLPRARLTTDRAPAGHPAGT